MKKFFVGCLGILLIYACTSKRDVSVILDIKEVVNKRPMEVEEILGKPDSTYTIRMLGKSIFCQLYKKNNIEIQYHDSGLATDIVIYGPHSLPFDQSALKAFNLDIDIPPSQYMEKELLRWYDVDKFAGISFYHVEKDSFKNVKNYYIFFKAKEQP